MDENFQIILASLIIFLFGLGLNLLVHFTTKKRKYILKNGIEVEGEIISHRAFFNQSNDTGLGTDNTSYYLSCRYLTENKEKITKEFTDVSYRHGFILRHPIGSKITIMYLPENPQSSVIKNYSLNAGFVFMKIVGFGLFALSVLILFLYFRTNTI